MVIISCIGFWSSLVFYNSYLPDLVPEALRDRVSARGFTMGYIGSVLLQIICFIIVFFPEGFGLHTEFEKSYMPAQNILCAGGGLVVRLCPDTFQGATGRQY